MPAQSLRYRTWRRVVDARYGSVSAFLQAKRLPPGFLTEPPVWPETPLVHPDDWCIRRNDWPYAMEAGITHLVVWLRAPLPVTDDEKKKLTPEGREMVDRFVDAVFRDKAGRENVLWFKNWASAQTVQAVEHFHVFVRNVPEDVVDEWVVGRPQRNRVFFLVMGMDMVRYWYYYGHVYGLFCFVG